MKKILFVALAMLSLLTGCDQLTGYFQTQNAGVVSVIAPNYKVDIGSGVVSIRGEDKCPSHAFSDSERTKNCIVIDGRESIPVAFEESDGKQVRELWKVERQGSQVLFRRPNGFLIRNV